MTLPGDILRKWGRMNWIDRIYYQIPLNHPKVYSLAGRRAAAEPSLRTVLETTGMQPTAATRATRRYQTAQYKRRALSDRRGGGLRKSGLIEPFRLSTQPTLSTEFTE